MSELSQGTRPTRLTGRVFAYFFAYAILQPASRHYASVQAGNTPEKFVMAILLWESVLTGITVVIAHRLRPPSPSTATPLPGSNDQRAGLASGVLNQAIVAATLYYISVTPTLLGGVVILRAWSLIASVLVDLGLSSLRQERKPPRLFDWLALMLALAAALGPTVFDEKSKRVTPGNNAVLVVYIIAYVARLWLITRHKQRRQDSGFEARWFLREITAATVLFPFLALGAVSMDAIPTATHIWAPLVGGAVLMVSFGATTILGYADRPAVFGMVITRCLSLLAGVFATVVMTLLGMTRAHLVDFIAAGLVLGASCCLAVDEQRWRREERAEWATSDSRVEGRDAE